MVCKSTIDDTNCYKSANIVSMHVVTNKKIVQTGMISECFLKEFCYVEDERRAAVDCSRLADQRRRTLGRR